MMELSSSKALIILCLLLSIENTAAFQAPGFSLEIPGNVVITGGEGSGMLTSSEPCFRLNILWIRDVGIDLDRFIESLIQLYSGNGLKIESYRLFGCDFKNNSARCLDINYSLDGYKAEKSFAVWYSPATDRFYLASLVSCPDNRSILLNAIKTISEGNSSMILPPRRRCNDTWSLLLGDLLSSWKYSSGSYLSAGQIHLNVAHTLSDRGLTSYDAIEVSFAPDIFIRPALVFSILRDAGYEPVIVQKHGRIWIAVRDGGVWQAISLNPSGRAIGALVFEDSWYNGIVYEDLEDFERSNSVDLDIPDGYAVRRCDPSRYVQLERENLSDHSDLDKLLKEYGYMSKYGAGSFDCSNTSQVCWSFLEGNGYDAYLLVGAEDHPLGEHMWVVVKREQGYIAVETAEIRETGDFIGLGRIKSDPVYYSGIMYDSSIHYSMLNPEEGMWLEPGDERIWSWLSR